MYILFNIHLLYAKNNSSIVHDRFIKPLIIADSIDQVLEVLHMANSDCEYSCCVKKSNLLSKRLHYYSRSEFNEMKSYIVTLYVADPVQTKDLELITIVCHSTLDE